MCWDCDGAIISEDSLELHCATEHPLCTICGARMISSDALLEVCRSLRRRSMLTVQTQHINEEHPGKHTMIEHLLDPVDTQNTFELHQSDFLNRDDIEMSSDDAEVSPVLHDDKNNSLEPFQSKENGTSEHRDATHTKLDTEESVRGLHDVTGQNRIVSVGPTPLQFEISLGLISISARAHRYGGATGSPTTYSSNTDSIRFFLFECRVFLLFLMFMYLGAPF